mmetsp:Transcript_54048/g.87364  ORF Transcript_54048/g.87364 Transcript_54048/m.87364 type:complete len:223 (+) Transcript_54048:111-779(+)
MTFISEHCEPEILQNDLLEPQCFGFCLEPLCHWKGLLLCLAICRRNLRCHKLLAGKHGFLIKLLRFAIQNLVHDLLVNDASFLGAHLLQVRCSEDLALLSEGLCRNAANSQKPRLSCHSMSGEMSSDYSEAHKVTPCSRSWPQCHCGSHPASAWQSICLFGMHVASHYAASGCSQAQNLAQKKLFSEDAPQLEQHLLDCTRSHLPRSAGPILQPQLLHIAAC